LIVLLAVCVFLENDGTLVVGKSEKLKDDEPTKLG